MEILSIYERMILSDLRPNLSIYETREGIEQLKTDFYSFKLNKTTDPTVFLANLSDVVPSIKPGDSFELDVDNDNHKISITLHPNPDEEELINIDLEPPMDDKGEVFYQIIGDEFLRIRKKLNALLTESSKPDELNFAVLKFITKAKQLGREAHTFEKRLRVSKTETAISSRYAIKILKKYLVYTILEAQQIFSPVLKLELQSEDDIEDELYEFSATEIKAGANRIRIETNKKHLERLHAQIPAKATLLDKINFFETKVREKLHHIATNRKVFGVDINDRDLYLEELGRLSARFYDDYFAANEAITNYKQLLEFLLKTQTKLLSNKNSVEHQSLQTTDFFFRLSKQIELIRKLVAVDPKAHALGLLGDISTLAMMIQGRPWIEHENHLNDYLADLLRAKQYQVSDQTRNGMSGSRQGSGSLDIAIRDGSRNGIIVSIIESFILESCGPENKIVGSHLKKLTGLYDTSGNSENFAVVFARASDFDKLWLNYKQHIDQVVFAAKYQTVDYELAWLTHDKVKVGLTEMKNGRRTKRLLHVFINMHKPKAPGSNGKSL
jgi:hypothetical protein